MTDTKETAAAATTSNDDVVLEEAPDAAATNDDGDVSEQQREQSVTPPPLPPPKLAPSAMTRSTTSVQSSAGGQQQPKVAATMTHFHSAVNSLLDCIVDKDEQVRRSVESALSRTVEKRPNEALMAICDFRAAHPKLTDAQVAILLRIIENFTAAEAGRLHIDPLQRLITVLLAEITRHPDRNDAVQRPAVAALVSLGRLHCDTIMDALSERLHSPAGNNSQPQAHAHFQVLHCMGCLATVNQSGIVAHLKPVLIAVLPTLSTIRADYIRQAFAQAIGRFAEAITECSVTAQHAESEDKPPASSPAPPQLFFDAEMAIAYDVLINQWLPCRDPKLSADILQALAHMYGLLPAAHIDEQAQRVVAQLIGFYRRSMDRNAITLLLAAVLKATLDQNPFALSAQCDPLCVHLFDLVCVNPDYERPQTVKGHCEVLRCFDRLFAVHPGRVADMLLVQLRSNNERERIKSLLVLAHVCNLHAEAVRGRLVEYTALVRPLLHAERSPRMKMVLLKLVLAFAQNGLVESDGECVRFLLRNCCGPDALTAAAVASGSGGAVVAQRESAAGGAIDAELTAELQQMCRNSLYMLVASVPAMDELMKVELLRAFVRLDHTVAAETMAKCLAKLFARSAEMPATVGGGDEGGDGVGSNPKAIEPFNPETVFVRCLILLGNANEPRRAEQILGFLKHFCPVLNKHLRQLWLQRIPEMVADLTAADRSKDAYHERLLSFVQATIRDVDDFKFAEFLVLKLVQQQPLYPPFHADASSAAVGDASPLNLQPERGMLLKLIGICVGYVSDGPMIDAMIELILQSARSERFDKTATTADWLQRFGDCTVALGHVSRCHLTKVLAALRLLLQEGGSRKTGGNFLASLNFLKDATREADIVRTQLLAVEAYRQIAGMATTAAAGTGALPLDAVDGTIVEFLGRQLTDAKDVSVARAALQTLRSMADAVHAQPVVADTPVHRMVAAEALLGRLIKLDVSSGDRLALFALVLQLATVLLQLQHRNADMAETEAVTATVAGDAASGSLTMHAIFEQLARQFFVNAQQLRNRFDTVEADVRNSFVARHLNDALPALNQLVRVVLERGSSSPATLDEVTGVLEPWLGDANSEVRICAGHVLNHALGVFMRTVRIGGEAPARFGQCGTLLAMLMPRCADVNATVRQTAVSMLRKTLEVACVYESLTVADAADDWVRDLERLHEEILTDDPKEMYRMTGDLARIVAQRLSNFQYLQFCKGLLGTLNDVEQSSAFGASVVLRSFVQIRGGEMFHAIPDLSAASLWGLERCKCARARTNVLKALVALCKHHPIAVYNEMLAQPLPYDQNVRDFWTTLATYDPHLGGIIIDNFLATLSASCLYESHMDSTTQRRPTATAQPLAIHCALRELIACPEMRPELQHRFPELFAMLLTTLATYTNLAGPLPVAADPASTGAATTSRVKFFSGTSSSSSSTAAAAAAAAAQIQPCAIVLATFRALFTNLGMEQLDAVLAVCPKLAQATDLIAFIELLAPMAVGLVQQLRHDTRALSQTVQALSRAVSSPYDPQRIAAVGLYAQLVPLRSTADGAPDAQQQHDVTAIIMLHLNSGLADPNALVRGLCVRGLAHVAGLDEHACTKYAEIALAALLKGVDDHNANCPINVPLESMLGLSRLLNALPREKLANFQVSLAIRLRPFFENLSSEIREAAVLLFGDLCRAKHEETVDSMMQMHAERGTGDRRQGEEEIGEHIPEALREQLLANFVTILLHMSELDVQIVRACKITLRRVCTLLNAPLVNGMVQQHLPEHGHLNYDVFVVDLLKLVAQELNDNIPDFIEATLPFLKSNWPPMRGNAAIVIAILHNLYRPGGHATEIVGQRLTAMLRDDHVGVRVKAAHALGYMFGDV